MRRRLWRLGALAFVVAIRLANHGGTEDTEYTERLPRLRSAILAL